MRLPETDGVVGSSASGAARTRRRGLRSILWVALLAIVAGGTWWWYGGRPAAEPPRASAPAAVPVEVSAAESRDLPIYLRGLGTVQAFNTVLVRSRVDGEITRIAFQEGQTVREGDILAIIDQRPYQAALDQALAKKAQDEATLRGNRLDLDRTQQLASRDFASRQQFDQRTAAAAAGEALVKADQAAIDNAQTQLDYTTIRSPITGRLGLRLVDQGNIVRASDTTGIVEVAQLQPISVIFTAPEAQLGQIRDSLARGDVEVAATNADGKSTLGIGKLALVNNQVDAASGTVRLKAVFPNDDNRLWPGLSVNTRLRLQIVRGATVIPEDAVLRGQDSLFAFVVVDGKAERRKIGIGEFSEGYAIVTDGLKPGEQVVTAGQSRLMPGTAVDVKRPGRNDARDHLASGERKPETRQP
jgi:multidrug efflux system membrane fusion protein